jgi:hypothetical protein
LRRKKEGEEGEERRKEEPLPLDLGSATVCNSYFAPTLDEASFANKNMNKIPISYDLTCVQSKSHPSHMIDQLRP